MSSQRKFDLILWGATGFTGRLVAQYLATAPSAAGLRWAIAGRNRDKLQRVRDELALGDTEVLTGDATDAESLRALARESRVVCTTVGPYARYGSELVAACVAEHTHYCDLTGEVPWIREMIDRHHDDAAASGTRIVHCCGFDSIPSDMGVFMLHESMKARGEQLAKVDAFAGESKGKLSGGTFASMLGIADAARRDARVRKVLGDPYALDPSPRRGGPDGADARGISYDKRLGKWTAPFVMAAINTRVVRRSNAVAGYPYGEQFRYSERMSLPGGLKGMAAAGAIAGGLLGLLVATQLPLVRPWLENKMPKPGEGPSKAEREAGFFVMRLLGESTTGTSLVATVSHNRDPGYGSTSVMLAESALCLAKDPLQTAGGLLTPASALGVHLLERLQEAGMTWMVVDDLSASRVARAA